MYKNEKEFAESLLEALCNEYTPSGHEAEGVRVLKELSPQPVCYTDHMNNCLFKFGHGPKKIMLTGHIDEIHCRVTKVFDNGILAVKSTGGVDRKSFIGSEVVVLDCYGTPHFGATIKKPIHLEDDKEYEEIGKWTSFRVDIGAESAEEVKKLNIFPGCYVVYPRVSTMKFGKNRVCATGLDDKVGVLISMLIYCRLLGSPNHSDIESKYTIYAGCTSQEETGCRGAQVLARNIDPHISIDFDVTFATDDETGSDANDVGTTELGKGGVISFGSDKTERLSKLFKHICDDEEIPYQTAATSAGGTNTNSIELACTDCETLLISIPNRSMHTQVEVCDWRDIFSIVDMVEKAITNMEL